MKFLLDTNTCIDHLRQRPGSQVSQRLTAADPNEIVLCSIVVAELMFGAKRSSRPTQSLAAVQTFCARFPSLPFDDRCVDAHSDSHALLARQGNLIGPHDLLIAAIALTHGLTLVTNNVGEFSRIASLQVEDWRTP